MIAILTHTHIQKSRALNEGNLVILTFESTPMNHCMLRESEVIIKGLETPAALLSAVFTFVFTPTHCYRTKLSRRSSRLIDFVAFCRCRRQ